MPPSIYSQSYQNIEMVVKQMRFYGLINAGVLRMLMQRSAPPLELWIFITRGMR